ncbi:MAG TPA: succinate dehydrogenase, cytochrome b556 subunit [Caulobacteraceae bacterium]
MAEALPPTPARPLSPRLSVWRWHVTMTASILHRVTGVGLYGAALVLTAWALSLASGQRAYDAFMGLLGSLPGKAILFAVTVTLFFHLLNGVRHLAWDMGKGFTPRTADTTAWGAMLLAILAAVGAWIAAAMGAAS